MRLRNVAIIGVMFLCALPSVAAAYTVEGPSKGPTESTQQEAEHKAQETKEANERAAKSAEEKKATEERQQHEAAEHAEAQPPKEATEPAIEPKTTEAEASQCVVPSLKGDSLARATTMLRKAHCKLGKVNGSHKGKGGLVVVSQKRKPGTRSAAGTAVGVTLGPAKHAHR